MFNIVKRIGAMELDYFRSIYRAFNGPGNKTFGFRMEKKQGSSADIYLYDIIGETWDGQGTTAKQFSADLKALGDVKTLNIYINSEGGSVFDGVAIYNMLLRNKATKNVYVDGLAASIASVIAMAGNNIQMAKNSLMMIHNPWAAGLIVGTADDFRAEAERIAVSLDKIREAILTTYTERAKASEKQIATMMDEETWMTADEAVKTGFADSIGDREVAVAAFASHDFTKFKNCPQRIRDMVAPAPAAPVSAGPKMVTAEETATKLAAITDRQTRLTSLLS